MTDARAGVQARIAKLAEAATPIARTVLALAGLRSSAELERAVIPVAERVGDMERFLQSGDSEARVPVTGDALAEDHAVELGTQVERLTAELARVCQARDDARAATADAIARVDEAAVELRNAIRERREVEEALRDMTAARDRADNDASGLRAQLCTAEAQLVPLLELERLVIDLLVRTGQVVRDADCSPPPTDALIAVLRQVLK